jgi:anti-sigma factor RsiW
MKQVTESDLHAYVDGQLPEVERAGIENWLASHSEEAERVSAYRDQNAALRSLFNPVLDEPVPATLFRSLARAGWQRYALAAGIFVVGIGLGWGVRGVTESPVAAPMSLARQAAIAHAVYAPEVRHPVEVTADQEDHLVKWLSTRLGTDLKNPNLLRFGYELVGGRLLSGAQGPVAQFMYQDSRGQRLTLYVSRQKGEPRDTAFRFAQEDRVSVFYWVDGNYGYALSGEIGKDPLLKIANVVYKQLNP